jgi:septal ring factor EnvC (AmiA/AmiB activator)
MIRRGDISGLPRFSRNAVIAALTLGAVCAAVNLAPGEERQGPQSAREVEKIERQRELEILRGDLERKKENEAKLKAEADAIRADRAKLAQELVDAAAKLRTIENRIRDTEARLAPLTKRETEARRSFEARRDVISEVLAALTRIGRNPAPALLLRPEDTLTSVRSAILLNAVIPEMRAQAEILIADLTELKRVREEIAVEQEMLNASRIAQDDDRARLAVLVEARQRQQADAEKILQGERTRTQALAKQVNDVTELVSRMEKEIAAAARAAEAARKAAESKIAAFGDPNRISPAIPFAQARGKLLLPVDGTRVREYGTPDDAGRKEKGLSISTAAGTPVISPCDGWVVYAGVFRSYGRLLIINAGGGYHVLLAGMEQTTVELGQFVLTGEPVAVMGGPKMSSAGSDTSTDPVLFIEFRKDGNTIDPTPWWAETVNEKARG